MITITEYEMVPSFDAFMVPASRPHEAVNNAPFNIGDTYKLASIEAEPGPVPGMFTVRAKLEKVEQK